MESIQLSEFISTTLSEIAQGVKSANESVKKVHNVNDDHFVLVGVGLDKKQTGISFDIAISASEDRKDKAGFMVYLATIGAAASTEKSRGSDTVHRIKFDVALRYALS